MKNRFCFLFSGAQLIIAEMSGDYIRLDEPHLVNRGGAFGDPELAVSAPVVMRPAGASPPQTAVNQRSSFVIGVTTYLG